MEGRHNVLLVMLRHLVEGIVSSAWVVFMFIIIVSWAGDNSISKRNDSLKETKRKEKKKALKATSVTHDPE